MSKISQLSLVTPTLLDRTPILDDADNLTKAQNNQGIRDLLIQNIFTPQWHLVNGRILPSVTTNNLTLSLKTYAGTDPSATDFVIANIGGTLRKISSALSVTLALGTSWMNLGSAELATLEHDLFAYLGYNATDWVTIWFSRFSGMKVYSDFSITSTNEKYLAVSNRTTASANDPYEVIGRFSAILSLTPFNWSVPTFTPINLVQKPIYEGRLLQCFTTFTWFSANPTYTNFYQVLPGNHIYLMVDQTANGTSNATWFTMTMPCINSRAKLVPVITIDNGSQTAWYANIAASNIINMYPSVALWNFTASGSKRSYWWSCDFTI